MNTATISSRHEVWQPWKPYVQATHLVAVVVQEDCPESLPAGSYSRHVFTQKFYHLTLHLVQRVCPLTCIACLGELRHTWKSIGQLIRKTITFVHTCCRKHLHSKVQLKSPIHKSIWTFFNNFIARATKATIEVSMWDWTGWSICTFRKLLQGKKTVHFRSFDHHPVSTRITKMSTP